MKYNPKIYVIIKRKKEGKKRWDISLIKKMNGWCLDSFFLCSGHKLDLPSISITIKSLAPRDCG